MSTETNDMSWQERALEEAGVQDNSPMSELPIVKVYNKPMGGGIEDITKSGKIIIKRNGKEFEVLGNEIRLNILLVRKFYTGFVPRIDAAGKIQKDSTGATIKDFYYTPELDIFNKDNIPLGVQYKGGKREVLGKGPKLDFDSYCKEPYIEGKINPLFKGINTNQDTGERYTTSHMGSVKYCIYAKDLDTNEIYKIIPGGSYGKFNDIKDGTFEDLKLQATTEYKEATGKAPLISFINAKVGVKHVDGFYYLDWKLDGFEQNDNTGTVKEITDLVDLFNKERFVGVDFDKPLELIGYTQGLQLGEGTSNVQTPVVNGEITVEDLPFR